jgi:hypothetical protein
MQNRGSMTVKWLAELDSGGLEDQSKKGQNG